MLLGATSRTGAARSAGRSQAGGLSEADGQQKEFVLPDDEPQAADAAGPKTSAGQAQKNRSDARVRSDARPQSDARPRSRDTLDAGRDDQAVNPLAAASRPEPAQASVVAAAQGTLNPADALKIAGATQQAGQRANGLTGIAAWWQSAQGANQPATGPVQAMNGPAEGMAATWLQGQVNASAATVESQQAANQSAAATAPGAKMVPVPVAGKDLGPRTLRMPAQAGATATAGPAAATTGPAAATTGAATANPAGRAMPGAANQQVVPAGAEAKSTLPSVLPTATVTAGEATQTGQTGPVSQAGQAGGHRATTESLSVMAQQGVASAVGDNPPAEVNPNLQAQAKLIGRAEQTAKSRSDSLLESARPVEAGAAGQLNVLAGSQHADGAAQAAPHVATAAGEQRVAEASRPADQIIESVRQAVAKGQREVTINLNPPELGRVRLTMYSQGNEIHGRLDVDNPRTLTEIRHQAELLTQRLAEDGIAIRRLEVHQMSNSGGQTGGYSPQHQDSAGQMPWSHMRPAPAEQQRDRAAADAPGGAESAATRAAALAGAGEPSSTGGLNVWM